MKILYIQGDSKKRSISRVLKSPGNGTSERPTTRANDHNLSLFLERQLRKVQYNEKEVHRNFPYFSHISIAVYFKMFSGGPFSWAAEWLNPLDKPTHLMHVVL
jgi:hypothetical protein